MPQTLRRVTIVRGRGRELDRIVLTERVLSRIEGHNPNHDERGRFAESAGEGGGGGVPSKGLLQKVREAIFGKPIAPPAAGSFDEKLQEALQKPAKMGPRGIPIVSIDGKDHLVKRDSRFSESESLSSQAAKDAGVDVVEVKSAIIDGRKTNAVEMLPDSKSVAHIEGDANKAEALSKVPKEAIERQVLYDYVIGYRDPNDGNYLVKDQRFVGIDKDPSLTEGTHMSPPLFLRLMGGADFRFSAPEVTHMATAAERVATRLEKAGKLTEANHVRTRGEVLRTLLELHPDRPSVGQLEQLGQAWHLLRRSSK